MNRKLLSKTRARFLGLIAFIATGGGLIISTVVNEEDSYKIKISIIFGCLFAIGLGDYYKKLIERDDKNEV